MSKTTTEDDIVKGDVDITELTQLDVDAVSGVGSAANGASFALIKAAAEEAAKAGNGGAPDGDLSGFTLGGGTVGSSDLPAGADEGASMQALVTGEVPEHITKEILVLLALGEQQVAAKESLHPDRVTYRTASEILYKETSSEEDRLVAVRAIGSLFKTASTPQENPEPGSGIPTPADVDRLEKVLKNAVSPVEKQDAGYKLSLAKLKLARAITSVSKNQFEESVARTDTAVEQYKEKPSVDNTSLADQVRSIGSGDGTPESLGTPQDVGTSKPGYITGREIVGAEPTAHVTGQHEFEGRAGELVKAEAALEKANDPIERQDAALKVTRLRLTMAHGG